MSDFDVMLQRKKEEKKKRKRKDIDIINDNDDIIAQLLADMKNAADVSIVHLEQIKIESVTSCLIYNS